MAEIECALTEIAMRNRRLELNRSAGEISEILASRKSDLSAQFRAELSSNEVCFSALHGAWWRPRLRAFISPLSRGAELAYRFEPDFLVLGLWLVCGIALLLFGSIGVMVGLEWAEVPDKYHAFQSILLTVLGIYSALTCSLAWNGYQDGARLEKSFLSLFEPYVRLGPELAGAQPGAQITEIALTGSPELFLTILGQALNHKLPLPHRFQGQVNSNSFSFQVPNLYIIRNTKLEHQFQGTVAGPPGRAVVRWQIHEPGIPWGQHLCSSILIFGLFCLVKMNWTVALFITLPLGTLWPLFQRSLALGHVRRLQEEALTLLQRCAEQVARLEDQEVPAVSN
jgi:hypothetical protein